jgi:hypothetical protein
MDSDNLYPQNHPQPQQELVIKMILDTRDILNIGRIQKVMKPDVLPEIRAKEMT